MSALLELKPEPSHGVACWTCRTTTPSFITITTRRTAKCPDGVEKHSGYDEFGEKYRVEEQIRPGSEKPIGHFESDHRKPLCCRCDKAFQACHLDERSDARNPDISSAVIFELNLVRC